MYDVCVLKHVPVSAVNNHILDNNFQTEQIHQEIKQTHDIQMSREKTFKNNRPNNSSWIKLGMSVKTK